MINKKYLINKLIKELNANNLWEEYNLDKSKNSNYFIYIYNNIKLKDNYYDIFIYKKFIRNKSLDIKGIIYTLEIGKKEKNIDKIYKIVENNSNKKYFELTTKDFYNYINKIKGL